MSVKILIVEDEEDIRHLLYLHLAKEGYEIFEARDGVEALEIFNRENIDLLIVDVMMPRMDGFTLVKNIRESSQVPVIFLTAKAEEQDKILGLGLGADDYVVKPFSIIELLSRVNAHLRRYIQYSPKGQPSNLIKNGILRIDLDNYALQKNSIEIDLNPKEFKMLKLFMENLGRVFTKKQIYEAVWQEPYFGDSNTIMVHISHLRDKIEPDPKNPSYLKTIRGIGYRMENNNEQT
ncbi:DNA-binding response regulator, OmpR family, contains REC and winged-helix (wHTH) domain [Peptoclostridium litorale DSM 5388]|uniref:Stage 0 sporulation protein A homolog n=1 Tax=Peptoclostridium litorale DSM 5388 TaxID=1121324 RepID=A0A069RKH2_PEPLI|nr:response regulator transcription factor [Peptoclostridium litorale]KDR94722.1 putative alkaline phosphatase synthesis transcriptional regulatory protein PhoP [Peptoclostridium litorale DSM 5388]SIO33133.1 DNA-binding response regulator, OmpR family, contains REC and winged-helix (wHTH) domain [Peptoclostridium litorale DSM 5388]